MACEESLAQVVRFEQACRNFKSVVASGTPSAARSMRAKPLQCLTVVEGVFEGFVGQGIPLLEKIDPQHPLQPDGWTASLSPLG